MKKISKLILCILFFIQLLQNSAVAFYIKQTSQQHKDTHCVSQHEKIDIHGCCFQKNENVFSAFPHTIEDQKIKFSKKIIPFNLNRKISKYPIISLHNIKQQAQKPPNKKNIHISLISLIQHLE